MSQYKFLEKHKWVRPGSYAGFNPEGDTLLCVKPRDTQIVTESNWQHMLDKLKEARDELTMERQDPEASLSVDFGCFGARPSETCRERWAYVWSASCSMFGYIDYLMLRADAPDELKRVAEELLSDLDGYPILNEEDYSERQHVAMEKYWAEASESERQYWHEEVGLEMQGDGDEMPEQVRDRLQEGDMFV